jgi:hypothetical protein
VKRYGKFIVMIVAAVLSAVVASLADDRLDAAEWINFLIVALGAISVLGAGELPAGVWKHTKVIVAAATAAAVLLVSFVSDGWDVSTAEWIQVILAALAPLGLLAAPGPTVHEEPAVR